MSPLQRGLLLALVHVLLVLTLAGKLMIDRKTQPRVWVKAAPYDPSLPIRGRYVSLRPIVKLVAPSPHYAGYVHLTVQNNELVAIATNEDTGTTAYPWRFQAPDGELATDAVAFFIPSNIDDPSRRAAGEELWMEVTIPKKGPLRPIQLGVKKNGVLKPLDIH